jgi:hypothetical protein
MGTSDLDLNGQTLVCPFRLGGFVPKILCRTVLIPCLGYTL